MNWKLFRAFIQHLLPVKAFYGEGYNHIAADGKTLRGSSDEAACVQKFFIFPCLWSILDRWKLQKTNENPDVPATA